VRFFPSDKSSHKADLASCAVGDRSPSQGVERWPGHGSDHPSASSDDDVKDYSCSSAPFLCLNTILWGGFYLDVCEY
jgi:hypothetical protein